MADPRRIQRSRAKGWRKPEGAILVCRPSRWGNPWRAELVQGVGWCLSDAAGTLTPAQDRHQAHEMACAKYRRWAEPRAASIRADLRGRDLCCYCPLDVPCHADVLLEIANAREAADA